jgi:hypothetical protein
MSKQTVEKYLKPKKYQTEQLRTAEESDIIDPRIKIDLQTRELILKYRLTNRIQPTLSIPLAFNKERGLFELIETPSMVTSRLQAYYYPTLPAETTPGYVDLATDAQHRLYVIDDQALKMLKSIYNTLGDAGASPIDYGGATVLRRLKTIEDQATITNQKLGYPSDAETFTITPLGANASYYSPSRDFWLSRLSVMNVMGYADQATASNGVYIQLSIDGTNWDYQGVTATLPGAGAVSLSQVVTARFARAVWTNGATAQTTFRLGGRYAIAGSENPTISLTPPTQIDPICSICGKDLTETGDFFVENDKVYCPKCYANKRWKEVKDKKQWLQSIKAWRKIAKDEEFNRAKTHTPDDAEKEVS